MSKEFSSQVELRSKILNGVETLANNVATTLGPKGRNVVIHRKGHDPVITKDGVTVAKFIDLEDPFENIGAQLVKQASARTNTEAGDGTTTSTVLTRAFLREGVAALDTEKGVSVSGIKAGMNQALDRVNSALLRAAKQITSIDDIKHVALISSNGDEEIADVITTAVNSIGRGGSITIEEARSNKTGLDLLEGFKFDSGYAAQAFITDERTATCKYDNPVFLVTDARIDGLDEILPALEVAAREGRPFVIVADEIEGQALAALIMNTIRGTMKVVAIKAPKYGEERRQIMEDLAISLGAKYFSKALGHSLSEVSLDDFGSAKSIDIKKNNTTIVGGQGDPDQISIRIDKIDALMDSEDSMATLATLQERKNRLVSGVAVIKVGAATEVEMLEKKHRVEDALEAVRSAQQEGVIPGGGLMLHFLSGDLKGAEIGSSHSEKIGVEILRKGLSDPLRVLAENAEIEFKCVTQDLYVDIDKQKYVGYNFYTSTHTDMFESGIIDPVKVTRCALQNAVSVASTLLTTNAAIVEV